MSFLSVDSGAQTLLPLFLWIIEQISLFVKKCELSETFDQCPGYMNELLLGWLLNIVAMKFYKLDKAEMVNVQREIAELKKAK